MRHPITANEAHRARRESIIKRLAILTEWVNAQDDDGKNYGHVGSLGKIDRDLHELTGFLGLEHHDDFSEGKG